MSLPDGVSEYLNARLLERHRPACLRLAPDNRLIEAWGPLDHYGLSELAPGDDVASALPALASCPFGEPTELPYVTDAGGHAYHVHSIPDGATRFVVLVDASEELRNRQHQQQTTNELRLLLERERRLITELVDAQSELALRRKEAEEESRRRGAYIATMSHEFRTPLTALLSHGERLAHPSAADEIPAIGRRIQHIVRDQLWLIDNLLARARLDAEGFAIHRSVADIRALVDELSLVFAPLAADKALAYAAWVARDVPDFLLIDELHVRQVLVNLLANAIKFTSEGSVALEIDHTGDRLNVSVIDTGRGIPEDEQEAIFAPFNRGREVPRAPGAGLGLGIVRQLLDAMDGSVRIESALGRGTRISFELPAEPASSLPETAGAGQGYLILVAEDDPDIRDLLEVRLREADYRVESVTDGAALVESALTLGPSLVIVDVNMPRLDGPAAARTLRERGFLGPILALSGAAGRADIEHALASGCTEFIRKPPHMASLRRVIQRLVLAGPAPASRISRADSESKQM